MPYTDPEPNWAHKTWKRSPEDWQGAQRDVRAHLIATARRKKRHNVPGNPRQHQ